MSQGMEQKVMDIEWRRKYCIFDMTAEDVKNCLEKTDVILLPTGSCEQHGPHSPMGTDLYQALWVCYGAAEKTDVPVAPALWPGPTPYHLSGNLASRPGTITIRDSTYINLLYDICRSLIHNGFNKIVFYCGHLANYYGISSVARRIRYETGALIVNYVGFYVCERESYKMFDMSLAEFTTPPRHGAELETAGVVAWNPDLIKKDKAKPSKAVSPSWLTSKMLPATAGEVIFEGHKVGIPLEHYEYAPDGIIGDPTPTTDYETAVKTYQPALDYMVKLIEEVKKIKLDVHNRNFVDRV